MAERTGSRAHRPPPVPKARGGGQSPPPIPRSAQAPSAVDDAEESTQRFGIRSALSAVFDLLAAEAEALLTGPSLPDRDDRLADINLHLALLSREVLADADAAGRYLELAEGHPLAAALWRSRALGASSAADFDRFLGVAESLVDDAGRAALRRDAAEAWLYRFGDPLRAAEVARSALDDGAGSLAADLRELLAAALAAAEDWTELEALLTDDDGAEAAAEAAQLAFDRLGDGQRALEHLDRAGDAGGELGLYATGLLRELEAARVDGVEGALARRLELCDAGSAEAAALRFLLAQRQAGAGELEAAAAELAQLLAEPGADFSARLLRLSALELAQASGDWEAAAEHLRALAGDDAEPLPRAYRRRLAEILDHRLERAGDARAAWEALAGRGPTDRSVCRALERHLSADAAALVAHFEAVAERDPDRLEPSMRRAAAVAESRLSDPAKAVELAARVPDFDRHDLARLCRALGDRDRVAGAYRLLAADADARVAAALFVAAGAIELTQDRKREAEDCFAAAAERSATDLAARAALAASHRHAGRKDELAAALAELADITANESTRFDVLRELGEVALARRDSGGARDAYERALELRPDDGGVLHALAGIYDARQDWARAIELRHRAVDSIGREPEAAVVLMEIGRLEETERRDLAAALSAYERAHEVDPSALESLAACQRLYRQQDEPAALLRSLRRELELINDAARRHDVCIEIAQVAGRLGEGAEAVIDAYRAALEIDADSADALEGIEAAASAAGRWDVIAEVFAAARETASHVTTLLRAYRELGDWQRFVELSQRQIALLTERADKVEAACELAAVYERELGDTEAAAAAYKKALSFDRASRHAQTELARLLEADGRWAELARALEDELKTWSPAHIERQIELLLRLGEIRRHELSRASDAALAYEAVLEREAEHAAALAALEELYRELGRDADLLRILESVAGRDPTRGPELKRQIGALRERTGDVDGTIAAYLEAMRADPASRDTFTALETICYQHERWAEVMQLYQTAIEEVEEKGLRAYRLGDLYARRGQVQFQYLGELGEAAASYLRVIELEPDDDAGIAFLETIFTQQHDWTGLIAAHEKRAAASGDPAVKRDSLRRAAAIARTKSEDEAEAARIYRKLLEVEPGDREAIDALERYYRRGQDWDQLVGVLEAQLTQQPGGGDEVSIDLLERVARISEEGLRDEERAIRYYQKLLEADPGHKQALDALSRIYESTERWTEFVDVTRKLVKVTKDRNVKALLYFKCGSVMEAKFGKEEDAIRYYDAAIKTSAACLPAVHGLRDLYLRRKDWSRVIQTLELEVKLWQDDKERAGVFAQIGRIYADQLGQPDRAMHYYESALAVDPDCVPANRALFDQYFEQKQWDRAQPLAQALAQKAMRDGDATARSEFYRKRGIVARYTGDLGAAAESIVIALEIKPNNVAALDALMELASAAPQAYDFPATFRELEKIYRKRDDSQPLLARVMVAQAFEKTRQGDLEAAEVLFAGALERSPADPAIVSALVDLHVSMRSWDRAVAVIEEFLRVPDLPVADQVQALMRQAEIHADGEMDSARAVEVLERILPLSEDDLEVHYRLAQELYCLGRYDEAREAIERVISMAAAPGASASPERLSRYYYYLGRIIESSGDSRAAASQYRRAAEYDPGYGPPALALAKRAVAAGDQASAETLLIEAAHAAMQEGDEHSAVPLQRGLARILLAGGDRAAAIEAYRGILAVEADPADRFALAEIYVDDDLNKAIHEVERVIAADLRHAPAYRMLASFYARAGEAVRAARVFSAMELLGYAEEQDRRDALAAKSRASSLPLRNPLDAEHREAFLVTAAMSSPMGELFVHASKELTMLFPQPPLGDNLAPLQSVGDPTFASAVVDVARLFRFEPEVYVGDGVPRGVAALSHPRPIVVLDRSLLSERDATRRFLLGFAFEAVRGGYALLLSLGHRQRGELCTLMRSLFLPLSERSGPTNDFVRTLPDAAVAVLRRHEGQCQDVDTDEWVDGMIASARRGGLLACDDFDAAVRGSAILSGESLGVGAEGTALGTIVCGEDLFRFYLGDGYHRLREHLVRVAAHRSA